MKKLMATLCIAVAIMLTSCSKNVTEQITQNIVDTIGGTSPSYIITDYGAIADGKTDCGPIINKIISILPASGGSIVIPTGDFLLNTPVNLNKNFVTITGLNPGLRSNVDVTNPLLQNPGGGSKLILGSASAGINIPVLPQVNGATNRISGIVIQNLMISGGSTSHGTGINILQDNDGTKITNFVGINLSTGIYANASDAMNITNCWVSECKNSIYLANGIQNTINNCKLGAQPGGITLQLDNQQNFNITSNQIYPNGNVNLQLNNSTYGNISANNFQSYFVGMIEANTSNNNLINGNIFWMRIPSDPTTQLRSNTNTYGVLRISGSNNLVSNNSITSNWASPNNNPVTIRSIGGTGNIYNGLNISDITSSNVFYVSGGCSIFSTVPANKVYIDGSAANVYISY